MVSHLSKCESCTFDIIIMTSHQPSLDAKVNLNFLNETILNQSFVTIGHGPCLDSPASLSLSLEMSLSFKFLAIYSCRISGDAGSCSGQFTSLSRLTFSPRGRQPQVSNMFRLSSLARHLSTLPAVWQASRKVHLKNIDFNWFWLTLIDFIY